MKILRLVVLVLIAVWLLGVCSTAPAGAAVPDEWTLESPPDPEPEADSLLTDVSCTSASFCLAVGYDEYANRSIAETWDGEAWSVRKGGALHRPEAVSCGSENVCWAVGTYGGAEPLLEVWFHGEEGWVGGYFLEPTVPEGGSNLHLKDISCTAEFDCTVVGSYNKEGETTILAARLSESLELEVLPSDEAHGVLQEVSCASTEDCVAVGHKWIGGDQEALVERFDGEEWAPVAAPAPEGSDSSKLTGLSCATAGGCVALGSYYDPEAKKYFPFAIIDEGSGWSGMPAPEAGAGTAALSCASSEACLAVGQSGASTAAQLWDGEEWIAQSPPDPEGYSPLAGVSCVAPLACAAVGMAYSEGHSVPLALRYEPEWTLESPPDPQPEANSRLTDVACRSTSFCLALGYDEYANRSIAETWDGEAWSVHKGGVLDRPEAVSCGSEDVCWAVGTHDYQDPLVEVWASAEESWFGGMFTEAALPEGGSNLHLNDISCTAEVECIAVGSYNEEGETTILTERLTESFEWEVLPSDGAHGVLQEVSCTSAEDCVAVGHKWIGGAQEALVERFDGEEWSAVSAPAPEGDNRRLHAVDCTAPGECVALGSYFDPEAKKHFPYAIVDEGSGFAEVAAPGATGGAGALSCGSASACLAVGFSGSVTAAQSWDGEEWTAQSPPGPEGSSLSGVSCVAPLACAAVGRKLDEGAWAPLALRYDAHVPAASTEGATSVEAESATLNGTVNPNGLATTYHFEYGTTASYGTSIPLAPSGIGEGGEAVEVDEALMGLQEGTEYHYRVVASNEAGAVAGQDKTFTTVDLPETTIDSPTPTYTGHDTSPVQFSSDESGSSFKCTLDNPEEGPKPCEAPHTLPEKLGTGLHTFEVYAIDEEGNADPTPAKWTFDTAIYPSVPGDSKISLPEEGDKASHHFTLRAEWADDPEKGDPTGVSFQLKLPDWDAFKAIPAEYVRDGEGNQVAWPLDLPGGGGETSPVFFDAGAYGEDHEWPGEQKDIKLRAVFDGDPDAAGASEPVSVTLSRFAGASSDATEELGPLSLDLNTGAFTIKRTDVSIPVPGYDSNLEFTRTYNSAYAASEKVAGESSQNGVFGPGWEASAPVEGEYEEEAWQKLLVQHRDAIPPKYNDECLKEWVDWDYEFPKDECLEAYEVPAADWVEVLVNDGIGIAFDKIGEDYVAPEDAREYKLSKSSGNFVLVDPNGTRTTFTQNSQKTSEYQPNVVSFKGAPDEARMVYEVKDKIRRLKMIIAPAMPGIECDETPGEHYAPTTVGCRSLGFSYYEKGAYPYPCTTATGKPSRLGSITYYDAGSSGEGHQMVQYTYDEGCALQSVIDLRVTPELHEDYAYDWSGYPRPRLTELEPPGLEPWELDYYAPAEGAASYETRLKSLSRASLLESEPTAQTTIAYDVPLTGEEAPYDLGAETVAEWGQSDYPVQATAIFPPSEIPDDPPEDYSYATVHYLDPDGNEVNAASPAPPGVEGEVITTAETDRHGNVVRELGAQNRLEALEDENPLARSHELDSHSTYNADGTRMLESWGPLHEVRLQSGETKEARQHTTIEYDEGAPTPKEDEPWPNLPTKETTGAVVPDQEGEYDQRVTRTHYNLKFRKPDEEIVDPGGLHLSTTIRYDASGQVIEERQPSDIEGEDAGTTKTHYYSAGSGFPGCGYAPGWAGLPCRTRPAASASPNEENPEVPWTLFKAYSPLGQPTEIQKERGFFGDVASTTELTYDSAGRLLTTHTTGEGAEIPAAKTTYDLFTGAPVSQEFVCAEECEGFDSQKVTTTHDSLGRPIEYEDADGNVSGVAYDLLGRPVATSDGKGTQEVAYDAESGVVTQMTDSAAGIFTAAYDADGQTIEAGLPNGLTAHADFDETGTPTQLTYEKTAYCGGSCTWLEFDREESIHGQVLKQQSTLSEQEYAYDAAGRLVLAKDTEEGDCTTRAYEFDANTNRTKLITREPGEGGACDTESEGTVQNYEYDTADRLIGEGVEYDDLGRITSLPAKYSGGGKLETTYYVNDLTQSQTQDGVTNAYELDAGLRQRERVRTKGEEESTEIYHYANGSDSPSWVDEGEGQWSRFIGGIGASAIEKSAGEEITLQLADMHGDIVATADIDPEATELLSTQQFDEYGNPKVKAELAATPKLGWLGSKLRRTELPSGVIQMGVRSYVPAMGRFLSPDPVKGGSANAYEYAAGDPVNNFDLTGERCRGKRRCAKLRRAKKRARRAIKRVRALVRERRGARASGLPGLPGINIPRPPWQQAANKATKRASNVLAKVDQATSCDVTAFAAGTGSYFIQRQANRISTQAPALSRAIGKLSSRISAVGLVLSGLALVGAC